MIRFGLPVPIAEQMRIGARRTIRSAAAALDELAGDVRAAGVYLLCPRARRRRQCALAWADQHLAELEQRYDGLVDVLCWAAKEGDHTGCDQRYADAREWFVTHYRHVQPVLGPLATVTENGADLDALHSLFAPERADPTIQSPEAIKRLFATQSAMQELRRQVEARREAR